MPSQYRSYRHPIEVQTRDDSDDFESVQSGWVKLFDDFADIRPGSTVGSSGSDAALAGEIGQSQIVHKVYTRWRPAYTTERASELRFMCRAQNLVLFVKNMVIEEERNLTVAFDCVESQGANLPPERSGELSSRR